MQTRNDLELDAFYSVIAPFYDQDYAGILEGKDVAFYLQLAEAAGGPVIEMGCGTGRVLIPLARAGITIHGMDSSQAMLDQLHASLESETAETRSRVSLTHGDIRSTDVGRRFALVTVPANVPHSFLERHEQRAWLANARRHLAPGGALCFDVFQPNFQIMLLPPGEWFLDADRFDARTGHRVRRFHRCEHELEFQRFRVEMRWVEEDTAGHTLSETSSSIMQRWFTRGELELLLELEGFRITDYWGNFDRAPFGAGATHQIVSAVPGSQSP